MKRIPVALQLGLAIPAIVELLMFATTAGTLSPEAAVRANLFWAGGQVAGVVLLTVGLFDLARRATGKPRRLVTAAAMLASGICAWFVVRALAEATVPLSSAAYRLNEIFNTLHGVVSLAIVVLLAVAARGRPPAAVALAVIAVLARGWFPWITDDVMRWLWENRALGLAYSTAICAVWMVGMWSVASSIARDGLEAPSDPTVASKNLRWIANALRLRVIATIALSIVGVGLGLGLAKAVVVIGPVFVLACTMAAAIALLGVARAAIAGLPNRRLVLGAAMMLWWCGVQVEQMVSRYRAWGGIPDRETWMIGGPMIGVLGLALLGSAISAFAHKRANDELREAASVRTLLYVVLSVSHIGIQSQVFKASTRDGFLMLTFVAAGAGIAALLSLAGLAAQAAAAIDEGASLPAARVVDK